MTYQDIANMVQSIGLPNAYYEFPENTGIAPPFICFYYPDSDDLFADNQNYTPITRLNIELYTDDKDFKLENDVETVLREHDLTYHKTETRIKAEKMWMSLYEMEVMINE